jgi:hypothetical protein
MAVREECVESSIGALYIACSDAVFGLESSLERGSGRGWAKWG